MRINQYVAKASGLSRRAADKAIESGQVLVNGRLAETGYNVQNDDVVTFNYQPLKLKPTLTIIFNKPIGYICSRNGQGSQTIYDLLPAKYHNLKPVGRLDKDSSGLLVLTNDGELANQLTHPSFQKEKIYEVKLNKTLTTGDQTQIFEGVKLHDGLSSLRLQGVDKNWKVTMSEGRNRQIRRTFDALGYTVVKLHRIKFGDYQLRSLAKGKTKEI
ncbi:MAG TPA: pseudouridine synthase [Candidatus Saccharimonadales bacterium]|nr:pseudouridine synthase [Candidatus Saccharimonadales bacterium]